MANKCASIANKKADRMAQPEAREVPQLEPVPFTAPPDACMWLRGYGKWYPAAKKENLVPLQTYEVNDMPKVEERAPRTKVRFVPIFLALLSLLIIAVMVIGKFALKEYLALLDGRSGLDVIITDLPACFKGNVDMAPHLVSVAIAVIALASVINLVANLVCMFRKGASVLSKICIFFMFVFSVALTVYGVSSESIVGYGLYAIVGLSLLSLLFGYLAKKD